MRGLTHFRYRDEAHRRMGSWHEFVHWLYEPAEWGRKEIYRVRWGMLHRIHLIPGSLMRRSCARAEREKR